MTTLIRILCLCLCLGLAAHAAPAAAETSSQQGQEKPKSAKKDSKDKKSKSKSKDGKQSKKGSKKTAASGPGFRALAWGAPLSALANPDLREESGDLKYYTVPGDDMVVEGVHMREIVYVFCKNALVGTLTRYDGAINHLSLLARLTEAHGAPVESPPNVVGDRSWRFDAQNSSIMMEYSEKANTGAVAWMARDRLSLCQPGGAQ